MRRAEKRRVAEDDVDALHALQRCIGTGLNSCGMPFIRVSCLASNLFSCCFASTLPLPHNCSPGRCMMRDSRQLRQSYFEAVNEAPDVVYAYYRDESTATSWIARGKWS